MRVTKQPGKTAQFAKKHPLLHHAPARPARQVDAFDMEWVGRWYQQHMSSRYRQESYHQAAEVTTALIQAREWENQRFLVPEPFKDQIETCEPTHIRDMQRATDPQDPLEIKPTWCSYRNTVYVSDYAADHSGTLPGWIGETDAEGWFRDTIFRQRALYFDLDGALSDGKQTPVLVHLTGSVEVLAEQAGAVTWFAPAVSVTYGPAAEHLHPGPKPAPHAYRALVNRGLSLPARGDFWGHSVDIDLLFNITALAKKSYTRTIPTLRLTLAPMPSFGRYHAHNTWAEGSARLDAKIIVCRR
jgi:hypothetical protein